MLFAGAHRLGRHLGMAVLCGLLAAPLHAADRLTFCFERKVVPPWRNIDKTGLNFELLKRVEAKLKLTFDYKLLPWKRCLVMLQANQLDGAFSVSFTDDRRTFGAFPGIPPDVNKRMNYARYFLVRRLGSKAYWDGERFHNIDGKISFQLGYAIGDMLRAHQVAVDETSDSLHNVGRKIVAGRVSAAALMDSDMEMLLAGPLGRQLEVLPTPLSERAYYLMLSERLVREQPELAKQIWDSVEEVRNSREYGRLVRAAGAESAR